VFGAPPLPLNEVEIYSLKTPNNSIVDKDKKITSIFKVYLNYWAIFRNILIYQFSLNFKFYIT